mgnify:CR=1 FL=1
MNRSHEPEVWLTGPVNDVPALLQPVAHALLQARNEVNELMENFPDELLWKQVAGMASAGFHLQHLTGVLDRLFTYAKGAALNEDQLKYLTVEGKDNGENVKALLNAFNTQIDRSIDQLKQIPESRLTEPRGVGRAQLPSTVIGLLVHSAEQTMRQTVQWRGTGRVVYGKD